MKRGKKLRPRRTDAKPLKPGLPLVTPHQWAAIALLAVTAAAFSNACQAGISLDTVTLLLKDPRIREATAANVNAILHHTYYWPSAEAGLYRPFTTLSFLFQYAILAEGELAGGYHALNLILHAGNVLLVYVLVSRFDHRVWPAALITCLWAVHPVQTEAVTNIAGHADLLAACSTLSGFLIYLEMSEAMGWRRIAWFAGLMSITTIGVFAKENAVCLPGLILAYEFIFWEDRRQARSLFLGGLATLLPILAMLYQRSAVLANSTPAELPFVDNPIAGAAFLSGRLTALGVMARYLWILIWPMRLSADYSFSQISLARGSVADWFVAAIVLGACILAAPLYRWNRNACFFACFAGVTFLPVSNLLFPVGSIMAERFLYMPSIGFLAAGIFAIYSATRRIEITRSLPTLLCACILCFAVRTWLRNLDWDSDLSITEAAAAAAPNSFKPHEHLAALLFAAGPVQSGIDRSIAEAEKSITILDRLSDARNLKSVYRDAGGYYLVKGDLLRQGNPAKSDAADSSRQAYQRAVEILERGAAIGRAHGPRFQADGSAIYEMLSAAYLRLGDPKRAADRASEAFHLHPQNAEAYRQIALALSGAGRQNDAAIALMTGMFLTADPGFRQNLVQLYREDKTGDCAVAFRASGEIVNPTCALVLRQVCAASEEAIAAHLDFGRPEQAAERNRRSVSEYHCPSSSLLR